ncbi:MAG TPA: Rab family GTPase [Candidatus Thermoplasmatota archaeon]|nr:Rab family GTPase [Candidatus Thermoplasmatota archaeon]
MESLEFEKKILLIGDGNVGKTSLVRRFVIDKFDDKYIITIGTKTSRKPMEFDYPGDGLHIKLQLDIWDILGQTGMERAHRMYFKGAEAVIIVCDGTRRASFDSVPTWAKSVYELCGPVPGAFAVNKVDLKESFQVSDEEAASRAKEINLALFHTSAKTGENVEAVFHQIGQYLCATIVAKYGGGASPSPASEPKKKGKFGR